MPAYRQIAPETPTAREAPRVLLLACADLEANLPAVE